jgi:hypothetical protein
VSFSGVTAGGFARRVNFVSTRETGTRQNHRPPVVKGGGVARAIDAANRGGGEPRKCFTHGASVLIFGGFQDTVLTGGPAVTRKCTVLLGLSMLKVITAETGAKLA